MDWGNPDAQSLLQRNYERTGVLPPAWKAKPELHEELRHVWEVFCLLCRTRQSGFDCNPLSLQDVAIAFEFCHVVEKDFYLELILGLDAAFLKWKRDKDAETRNNR